MTPTCGELLRHCGLQGRTVVVDLAPGFALPGAERLVLSNGEWIIETEAAS